MRPVIIIFGAAVRPDGSASGAMRARVAAAVRTGQLLAQPRYMPTGGQGRFGRPEAVVMAELLQAAGVPREAIEPEPTASNTLGSVMACAALLGRTRATVYVATSRYHLPRCLLLLLLAGYRARPGCPVRTAASARWSRRWFWRLREVPALPLDVALLSWQRLRGRVVTRS